MPSQGVLYQTFFHLATKKLWVVPDEALWLFLLSASRNRQMMLLGSRLDSNKAEKLKIMLSRNDNRREFTFLDENS